MEINRLLEVEEQNTLHMLLDNNIYQLINENNANKTLILPLRY